MFPFSGMLKTRNKDLYLPTLDASDFGVWPDTVTAGLRFGSDAKMYRRQGGSYSSVNANSWMHSESQAIIDYTDYECGVFSLTGDTGLLIGLTEDTYHPMTGNMDWYISSASKYVNYSINGVYAIREIANPSNVYSANFSLSIDQEGFE